jgi:hypothetical protein
MHRGFFGERWVYWFFLHQVEFDNLSQAFDWFTNILHSSVPFSINCISTLMIIIIAARSRSNAQKKGSYKKYLREQFHHHKHLLISPLRLILLVLPRLIIPFLFRCMKSTRNSWLYCIGSFISFIFHRHRSFSYLFYHQNFTRKSSTIQSDVSGE